MRAAGFSPLAVLAFAAWVAAPLAAQDPPPHQTGAHRHPDAAALVNPVTPDDASVAAGKALFVRHCAECHGDGGKGDGEMADMSDPKPANLTDAEWKHGSSDGEIFTVIRDGVKGTDMKPWSAKMTDHQIWDLVNFVRSIGPTPAKSH